MKTNDQAARNKIQNPILSLFGLGLTSRISKIADFASFHVHGAFPHQGQSKFLPESVQKMGKLLNFC